MASSSSVGLRLDVEGRHRSLPIRENTRLATADLDKQAAPQDTIFGASSSQASGCRLTHPSVSNPSTHLLDQYSSLPLAVCRFANMAPRLPRTFAVAALSLSWVTTAYTNYSSIDVDVIRAQLDLMDNRPKDCPPWYDTRRHHGNVRCCGDGVTDRCSITQLQL